MPKRRVQLPDLSENAQLSLRSMLSVHFYFRRHQFTFHVSTVLPGYILFFARGYGSSPRQAMLVSPSYRTVLVLGFAMRKYEEYFCSGQRAE